MEQALIIFAKNPLPGKTKTRLAATIGNEKALKVYTELRNHTFSIAKNIEADTFIFFSDFIEDIQFTNGKNNQIYVQEGDTLGDRMCNAFEMVFSQSYKKATIIGTDCPGLNSKIIDSAFVMLSQTDIIIGPAADGGYYLLGMNHLNKKLFKNIVWSTASVCEETINRCKENKLTYQLLSRLHDVDEEKDMAHFFKYIKATL